MKKFELPRTPAQWLEAIMNAIFFLCGILAVGCVAVITVYMFLSGLPAIGKIGPLKFLFGTEWASTAAEPKYGILPFVLSSIYGPLGASLIGVPVALVSIVLAWLILCWLYKPEIDVVKGLDSLKEDRKNVGPLKGDELKFTIVFAIMVVLWFIPKQTGIDMYMTAWGGIFIMSLPGMNLVNWKEASTKIDWSAFLICGAATALATVVANLGTGAWLSGILSNLFLSKVAGMGLIVLLLVINVMMAVGHYPMPQGVSLAGLCLPVVGALAVNLGLNPIVVCLPVCMSTSMMLLVPIDPTCFTTYSGGYWKIKDMMSSGILITVGYILVSSLWTAVIAATGALG